MFDLAAFDAEITRRQRTENPGEDILLAKVVRGPSDETGITPFNIFSGTMLGSLALASMAVPAIFRGTPADAMTFNGMTLDQFAARMSMSAHDPLLIAMFEQLCMV